MHDDVQRVRVLVSACLLGELVRYHGGAATASHPELARWLSEGRVVGFCPEVAGGLPVPRDPAEIEGGAGGAAVLDGRARVISSRGVDITPAFLHGARAALTCAQREGTQVAILKDGSPSCGSRQIFDGTLSGRRMAGMGVTAALLARHGIHVFSDEDIDAAAACVSQLERAINRQ